MLALAARPSPPAWQQPLTCRRHVNALAARGSPLLTGRGPSASWAPAPAAGTRHSWRALAVGPFWTGSQQYLINMNQNINRRFDDVSSDLKAIRSDCKGIHTRLDSIEGYARPDVWVSRARLGQFLLWAAGMAAAVAIIFMAKRGV